MSELWLELALAPPAALDCPLLALPDLPLWPELAPLAALDEGWLDWPLDWLDWLLDGLDWPLDWLDWLLEGLDWLLVEPCALCEALCPLLCDCFCASPAAMAPSENRAALVAATIVRIFMPHSFPER
jgi:hypothetical protein